ncbi:MAG: cytochrome P450 [Beijerinckiaceae bacterium]|nr:cytochrome P450 [Beijerinckiaceae bacterium]
MAELPRASAWDTITLLTDVIIPTLGKGVIIRRPRMVGLAERLGLDSRAVRRMQALRKKYGKGPLITALPGRRQAVLLAPDHVEQVLAGAPEPFSPRTQEKASALSHFEPKNSLISKLPERTVRRAFNESVLEFRCPTHSLADRFCEVVAEETKILLAKCGAELSYDDFFHTWSRLVRRIVLGDGAAEDHELTDMLAKLRRAGNWGFLHPGRPKLRDKFLARLSEHLDRAEDGSLAGIIGKMPKSPEMEPTHQVPQYLFAFDPGGMATFRALAVLATHEQEAARARTEISERPAKDLPFLRACILDSLRLWPTTPAILRETTQDVEFDTGVMPKDTHVLIFAPYFHRDDENLSYAHRFNPDIWLSEKPGGGWPLVPFSGGPAACPARDFVPMIRSAMMADILKGHRLGLKNPERLDPSKDMPGTLDNYSLKLTLEIDR